MLVKKWSYTIGLLFVFYLSDVTCISSGDVWLWECAQLKPNTTEKCVRIHTNLAATRATTLTTCQLTCGPYGSLFPRPQEATIGKKVVYFLPRQVMSSSKQCEDAICTLLSNALDMAKTTMEKYHPNYDTSSKATDNLWQNFRDPGIENHRVVVHFSVTGTEEHIKLDTDESYELQVTTEGAETKVMITAPTYFGARHAIESLTQLIAYDEDRNSLQIVSSAMLKDSPRFPYRGLIIDTARNFLSIKKLKQIIDAMSYNKLNSFHWHISDSQTFPLHIKAYPQMSAYGSYSKSKVYSAEDVKSLVNYARVRGIRVIPELDAPAHAGQGWQWGENYGMGPLVVCLDKQPWPSYCAGPPCGQMNIANDNLYTVLGDVYKEMIEMFNPVEMFHYGGDEVFISCWNTSDEVKSWMMENKYGLSDQSYFKQWSVFQDKAMNLLTKANGGQQIPGILWTSTLTEHGRSDKYLDPSKYIIQVWTKGDDPLIAELVQKKFKIIMSNYDKLYLDCGAASWVSSGANWCSPYKGWQEIYDNDIELMVRNLTGTQTYDSQLLGGEAAAWSEEIDEQTIDAKLWPRSSALAERLWTNPSSNFSFAEHRMLIHRQRLVSRGVGAARLQPEWCLHHEGECVLPWSPPKLPFSSPQEAVVCDLSARSGGGRMTVYSIVIFLGISFGLVKTNKKLHIL